MLHHEPVPRGSSPLARGTQHAYTAVQSSEGLIPARAGNTHRGGHSKKSIRAHPRSRGEHFVLSARLLWRMGSSPLARGTQRAQHAPYHRGGLIPARAGNTADYRRGNRRARAHPRSRGEHWEMLLADIPPKGSSPLARGTRGFISIKHDATGLIPARAGNTLATSTVRNLRRAHPRSRGEHTRALPSSPTVRGSSPLARGTQTVLALVPYSAGLIPARAGNTGSETPPSFVVGAHPRSRGEHAHGATHRATPRGSSPLARGTRLVMVCFPIG